MSDEQPTQTTELPGGISADELLRRTVRGMTRSAGRSPVSTPRWAIISKVTGLGAGYSSELCRWAGLDPEERAVRR